MKKNIIIFLSLIVYCQVTWGQKDFNKGVEAAKQNKFAVADSLFTEYLKKNPFNVSARFNLANVKLQLGDTCIFCSLMNGISMVYKDKEARRLFNNTCGKTDSVYYNENFELTTDKKPRYMIETIPDFCNKTYDVYIHDNKQKNASTIRTPDLMSSYNTNIIANYRLNNDGSKTYKFLVGSEPKFPGGEEKRFLYKKMNANELQAKKKEWNLYHVVVNVEYIVDKTGDIKDLKIANTDGDIKNEEIKEKLKIYVSSYFMNMPKHIPAKFRNENVDYLVNDFLSFW